MPYSASAGGLHGGLQSWTTVDYSLSSPLPKASIRIQLHSAPIQLINAPDPPLLISRMNTGWIHFRSSAQQLPFT